MEKKYSDEAQAKEKEMKRIIKDFSDQVCLFNEKYFFVFFTKFIIFLKFLHKKSFCLAKL